MADVYGDLLKYFVLCAHSNAFREHGVFGKRTHVGIRRLCSLGYSLQVLPEFLTTQVIFRIGLCCETQVAALANTVHVRPVKNWVGLF